MIWVDLAVRLSVRVIIATLINTLKIFILSRIILQTNKIHIFSHYLQYGIDFNKRSTVQIFPLFSLRSIITIIRSNNEEIKIDLSLLLSPVHHQFTFYKQRFLTFNDTTNNTLYILYFTRQQ